MRDCRIADLRYSNGPLRLVQPLTSGQTRLLPRFLDPQSPHACLSILIFGHHLLFFHRKRLVMAFDWCDVGNFDCWQISWNSRASRIPSNLRLQIWYDILTGILHRLCWHVSRCDRVWSCTKIPKRFWWTPVHLSDNVLDSGSFHYRFLRSYCGSAP